jgi:hypothetical protein
LAIGVLLFCLSAALQLGGVTSHQPAARVNEVLADTERATVEGTQFVAPAGWRIETRGPATIVASPEGNSHIARVSVHAADADGATNAAWAAYRPDLKWPPKVTIDLPDGWLDQHPQVHLSDVGPTKSAMSKRTCAAGAPSGP